MGTGNEQPAEILVPCLRDRKLGIPVTGSILAWGQTQEGADGTTVRIATWILQGQAVRQSGNGADSAYLAQHTRLRVLLLAE